MAVYMSGCCEYMGRSDRRNKGKMHIAYGVWAFSTAIVCLATFVGLYRAFDGHTIGLGRMQCRWVFSGAGRKPPSAINVGHQPLITLNKKYRVPY